MSSTVFRVQSEPIAEQPLPKGSDPTRGQEADVEVPYVDYENFNGKPYAVDYFQLGDTWSDPSGGFPKEIQLIEEYVQEKVNSGEIANNIEAIKDLLKGIEKTTGINKESRLVVRVETVASYIEFLNKTNNLKRSLRIYGNA